jgi:hypothetical protein
MRILTADEVSKEIRDIENRPWPLGGTVLFMKNLYQRYPPSIGYIERKKHVIIPSVRVVKDHEGQWVPYETLKAMVEDGWVPD